MTRAARGYARPYPTGAVLVASAFEMLAAPADIVRVRLDDEDAYRQSSLR